MSSKIEVSRELALTIKVTKEQEEDILRFFDTCEDNQGYDVPKLRMKSLARLGVIRSTGFSRYEITAAGDSLIEKLCEPAAPVVERQYYYRVDACKVQDSKAPACVCWHNEGTGPLFNNPWTQTEPKTWRDKPTPTAPPELAELQATIDRLTADLKMRDRELEIAAEYHSDLQVELERLKGGQGEPAAWIDPYTVKLLADRYKFLGRGAVSGVEDRQNGYTMPLYTSQPAPVSEPNC